MQDYGKRERAFFLRREPKPVRIIGLLLVFFLTCFVAGYAGMKIERAAALGMECR